MIKANSSFATATNAIKIALAIILDMISLAIADSPLPKTPPEQPCQDMHDVVENKTVRAQHPFLL